MKATGGLLTEPAGMFKVAVRDEPTATTSALPRFLAINTLAPEAMLPPALPVRIAMVWIVMLVPADGTPMPVIFAIRAFGPLAIYRSWLTAMPALVPTVMVSGG